MTIFVYRNGQIVPKSTTVPINRGPSVISDDLPDLIHPSNGQRYSSKSRFRAETRARGLTEIGNEEIKDTRRNDMPNLKQDIARAITELGG